MKKPPLILWIFLPCIKALCPDNSLINSCECRTENGKTTLFCESVELSPLTTMMRNIFCGQIIDSFYLRAPQIDHLPSNLFFKNIVYEVKIENANISHFTQAGKSAFFSQEPHLRMLSMRRCHLGPALRWEMISELRALTYLDVSYNKLKRVPKHWFHHPPINLRSLIMKENQITILENGAFRYMHKLNELDLSSNRIEKITRDVFPYPGNELIFLRLSDNNLHSLPENMFHEMYGLRRLYLSNNKIMRLSENVWRPIWGVLEHLELNGNSISYDCDLQWISELKPPQHLYGHCCAKHNHTVTRCDISNMKELRKLNTSYFDSLFC